MQAKEPWYKDSKLWIVASFVVGTLFGTGVIPALLDFRDRSEDRALETIRTTADLREQLTGRIDRYRRIKTYGADSVVELRYCYTTPDTTNVCEDRAPITQCEFENLLGTDIERLEEQLAELEGRSVRDLIGVRPPCPPSWISVRVETQSGAAVDVVPK